MKKMFLLATFILFCLPLIYSQDNNTPQSLSVSQNWSNTALITTDDDWAGVVGVEGYRGDALTGATGTDPQTILEEDNPGVVDVIANQTNPNTLTTGGVAEFEITNPVVALQGSGTADAPYLQVYLSTSGYQNIQVSYNVRDIDGSTDNALQPVAIQYRIGSTGIFTNLPGGYIADATTGPSLATLVTPVYLTLPSAANNQSLVILRIITTNAVGNDEWIGIDDIYITGVTISSLSEDEIVINEFVVNPSSGEEFVELLVVANSVDMQGLTISDVETRTSLTDGTEGDIILPSSAFYLSNVLRGTYIVIELSVPGTNSSTLTEDLSLTDGTPRTLILKYNTVGVSTSGTIDFNTDDNIQIFKGSRETGELIDRVLWGTNYSLFSGVAWGDNDVVTITDNINGGSPIPSGSLIRFVPSDQSSPTGFQSNDTGVDFVIDASSYGTPGNVNTGVDDSNGALPVELSSFTAKVLKSGGVQLNWRTETEISNYGFEILRSTQYDSTWMKIGFVEGNGNSNSPKDYSFTDEVIKYGSYAYRLKQIDTDGQFQYSKVIEVDAGKIPDGFVLEQNYPNPFNPVTTIKFSISHSGNVKLTVYNLLGEEIAELVNRFKEAGIHTINFDASSINSSIYIYKIEANGFVQSRKMTLIK